VSAFAADPARAPATVALTSTLKTRQRRCGAPDGALGSEAGSCATADARGESGQAQAGEGPSEKAALSLNWDGSRLGTPIEGEP